MVNKDIMAATKLIKKKFTYDDEFSKYCSIYAFTNENINEQLKKIKTKNKQILTVAGSGDHILELLMRNCKSIDCFDINILSKYYIDLKIAGIKSLEYDEFINFFIIDHNYYDVFNEQLYKKIRKYLNNDSIIFWDALYSKFAGNRIRTSKLFFDTEESYNFLKLFISYLNPENYLKIKEILNNPEINFEIFKQFHNCNVTELSKIYKKEKFDVILLSNIADYIDEIFHKNPLEKFSDYIKKDLANLLNEEGIINAAYMFWAYMNKNNRVPIINTSSSLEKLTKENFEMWLIDNSKHQDCTNDHILIYKK